jgi:hypothetical protein
MWLSYGLKLASPGLQNGLTDATNPRYKIVRKCFRFSTCFMVRHFFNIFYSSGLLKELMSLSQENAFCPHSAGTIVTMVAGKRVDPVKNMSPSPHDVVFFVCL